MVTKEEFREAFGNSGEKIGDLEAIMVGVKFIQKLLISLYLSIPGIVGAMFVKMFFFR